MERSLKIAMLLGALAWPALVARGMEMGPDRFGIPDPGLQTLRGPEVEPTGDVPALARLLDITFHASPLEAELLADAADGRLDEWTLARAALVAGGVENREALARYEPRITKWSAIARAADRPGDSPRLRAAALLELMHTRFMPAGYQLDATDLAAVLDHGQYNCVSATLLYLSLAAEIGLPTTAIELPTHAFCRVSSGGVSFDVEPTCRRWFEVIDDPAARAAVTRRIAGASADPAARPRSVSPVQLLAVIYYNRGVDLIRHGNDAGAIAANLRAMSLDPDNTTARGNLWVAVNNAALAYCRDGRFTTAADLIARARQVVPEHAALRANQLYVYQQWSSDLARQGKLAEALEVLNAALTQHPGQHVLTTRRDELRRRLSLTTPVSQPATLSAQ